MRVWVGRVVWVVLGRLCLWAGTVMGVVEGRVRVQAVQVLREVQVGMGTGAGAGAGRREEKERRTRTRMGTVGTVGMGETPTRTRRIYGCRRIRTPGCRMRRVRV